MAATASALVKRSPGLRFTVAVLLLHILGGVAAGSVIGFTLGELGELGRRYGLDLRAPAALVLLSAGIWDFARGPMASIQPPRGVPAAWRRWPPLTFQFVYGLGLGAGIFTPYTAAAMYGLVAVTFAIGDPFVGAVVFGTYGLLRAVVSMIAAIVALRVDLFRVTAVLQQLRPSWRRVLGVVLVALFFVVAKSG